eukprot:Blabericola_migrator_1__1397@NODE_1364_length_4709_cov_70_595648_g916_i0_p4_GENE_NODE_1364_length_4709_cov_70_595648_g916_i0NODE_1364_length_4709_cov_70_595648_g916_i0_p4_ORF_typecomplete_len210_score28_31_NODE_1364_length_4709_cov_70_595648_g916_i032453874
MSRTQSASQSLSASVESHGGHVAYCPSPMKSKSHKPVTNAPVGFVELDGLLLKRARVKNAELQRSAASRFPSGPQNSPRTDLMFTNKIKAYTPDLNEVAVMSPSRPKQVDFSQPITAPAQLSEIHSHYRDSSAGASTIQRKLDDLLEWQSQNNAIAVELDKKKKAQQLKVATEPLGSPVLEDSESYHNMKSSVRLRNRVLRIFGRSRKG